LRKPARSLYGCKFSRRPRAQYGAISHGQPSSWGIDLGAAEVKIAIHSDVDGSWSLAKLLGPGHPLASPYNPARQLTQDQPPDALIRIAVTGSGRHLLDGLAECRSPSTNATAEFA